MSFTMPDQNVVAGDMNFRIDTFVRDRITHITEGVTVNAAGEAADFGGFSGAISGDGSAVAFQSMARNLAPAETNFVLDVFVRQRDCLLSDLETVEATRASSRGRTMMTTLGKAASPWILAIVALITSSACDLVVEAGQTFVLGNRGSVFGSGGHAENAALPAVRVQPGGAVVVQDADIFGGGIVVQSADQTRFGSAGPGIRSEGGTVTVQKGVVQGGPIVLMTPASSFDAPAPGIEAASSLIEISAGSILGGSIVSFATGQLPSVPAAPALRATDSRIRITGGSFASGAPLTMNPSSGPVRSLPLIATRSSVEIRGGDFADGIAMVDGTARIFGGRGSALSFVNTAPQRCSELRGGEFETLSVTGGRVLVFGTGLALMPDISKSLLSGTLEDGTLARLNVTEFEHGRVFPLESLNAGCPSPGMTQLVSVNQSGQSANASTVGSAITPDGRFVVFESGASDLVTNDSNNSSDVFVRDLDFGSTERVSLTNSGGPSNGTSLDPSISADGRFVSFSSNASLAPPAVEGFDIFLRDRVARTTERISVSSTGEAGTGGFSANNSRVSDDGRIVAFLSDAPNLVPGDTNGARDVFVRDRVAGTTQRINVGSNGDQADGDAASLSMSSDGRFIAYRSFARNLNGDPSVQEAVLVHDRMTATTEVITVTPTGQAFGGSEPVISANGRFVAFSANAQLLGETSTASQDVFVRDRLLGVTERISLVFFREDAFFAGAISSDGRFVGFNSVDGSLRTAFVRDRAERRTEPVNLTNDGREAGLMSFTFSVSTDGRRVVFASDATELVDGDVNRAFDVFVRERGN